MGRHCFMTGGNWKGGGWLGLVGRRSFWVSRGTGREWESVVVLGLGGGREGWGCDRREVGRRCSFGVDRE